MNLPERSALSWSCCSVPLAESGGSHRNRRLVRPHAHVELGIDIDAHPVPRDQRVLLVPRDRHAQHVHADGRDIMDDREDEGAAVDHDLFAEEARADERDLLR